VQAIAHYKQSLSIATVLQASWSRTGGGHEGGCHLQQEVTGGLWFVGGLIPVVALVIARRSLGALNASAWLVAYGVLILLSEHAGFTFTYTLGGLPEEGFIAPPHARIHAFMAAVYATVGMVALAIMVGTLLRKRSRLAWAILLGAVVVGGSLDVVMNGPAGLLYRHTSPPNPIPGANVLWAYLVAWAAALLISWRPVFELP
jgi:hypothetical protein